MSTQTFLCSLKRFTSRRGISKQFISDNGTTFKGAAKLLKSVMSSHEVQAHLAGSGIEWLFNVEKAPWWGGRLIKSTKRCLRKLIGRAKLVYDELSTLLAKVEMVINSRPLMYVSSEDIQEPLTPSHFLTGRRIMSVPDSLCSPDPEDFSASKVEDLT